MIASSGRNIPDPPKDPEERRRWKTTYFADNYGTSPEQLQRILSRMPEESRVHRPSTRRMSPVRFVAFKILAPIGIIAAIVYLFVGCRRTDPEMERALDKLEAGYRESCVKPSSIAPEMINSCVTITRLLHEHNRL